MCLSMAPAMFSGTTLYAGRKNHPVLGPIEVLGYQNEARNLARTPNAMVLHIPAQLTQDNFIDVADHDNVLSRMVETLTPPYGYGGYGSVPGGAQGAAPQVQVFEHDIYTILLAQDPTQIPAALQKVPPHKRPPLDPDLFDFYAQAFPNHSIVLCCFDNADASRAKPLMMWYPPPFQDWIVLPALDGHTGGVPRLDDLVETDHWLVFGLDDVPPDWGTPLNYMTGMDTGLSRFLPTRIVGTKYNWPVLNGDFAIRYDDLRAGFVLTEHIQRLQPTWSPQ